MKELKKRCRGLFVLLLAVTFFLQGGWLMPSDAATSDEYLIVLQNSNTKSQIIGGENRPPEGYTAYDAIPLGVYKSTNGKINVSINVTLTVINVSVSKKTPQGARSCYQYPRPR